MARPRGTYTTQQHQDTALFDVGLKTPAVGSIESLSGTQLIPEILANWNALRDAGIKPLHVSKLDQSEQKRTEFLVGAHALGLVGGRKELKPQQYLAADAINADNPYFGMLMPRRSTKTTAAFAVAIGRCMRREGYLVAFTACTTGLKARARFLMDIVRPLRDTFKALPPEQWPFRIYLSGGSERIEFDNGSVFLVLPPEGEKFRSDAFDMIILDEAGEASPEMTIDLLEGALSTFDTRPGSQLLVAGTAAKYRDGNLLWDYLVDGRARTNRTGILEFAAPDSTTEEELHDWDQVKKLVLKAHPGIGTLTTLQTVKERWSKFHVKSPQKFAAEYLSIFGTAGATTGIFNFEKWKDHALIGALPNPPAKFAMAIAVHPDQLSACIVAAWRVRNRARLLVLAYEEGAADWLPKRARELSTKYRVPIAHDTTGAVTVEVETLARMRPKPRLLPQSFPNIKTAAALLVKEVEQGRVEHYNQEPLTEAIRLAKKRSVGPSAWALGRKNPEDDITCAEAAAIALRVYDDTQQRPALKPSVAA